MAKNAVETATPREQEIRIKPPNLQVIVFKVQGTSPFVQNRFSSKAMDTMRAKQEAGSTAKSKTVRVAKDFDEVYKQAMHKAVEGWPGIPASAFRNALISACRVVGFKMTLAKLSLFAVADGFDSVDGTPLIRIQGDPEPCTLPARNSTGVIDLRCRPMWRQWSASVRIRFDADQFTTTDVANLMSRVGQQVGIGEGRPDSRMSAGLGWGLFELVN